MHLRRGLLALAAFLLKAAAAQGNFQEMRKRSQRWDGDDFTAGATGNPL